MESTEGTPPRTTLPALLDDAFGVPQGQGYLDDFPIWADDREHQMIFGIPGDGPRTWAASTGVRLATLSLPGRRGSQDLSVALIGAVATDPAFRGKGLASQLVVRAVEWAEKRGAAGAFLWGSEHTLYQRLGFELCGKQVLLPLKSLSLERSSENVEIRRGWNPAIFGVMRSRVGGLVLKDEDIEWMAAHRHVDWYWTGPPAAPSAYAAIGRGIDLMGFVHEWGGETSALRTLLGAIVQDHPEAKLLGSPSHLSARGFPLDDAVPEFLCLAKVIDRRQLFRAAGIASSPEIQCTDRELARIFFGPEEVVPAPPVPGLPLPIWFWGLDAV